MAYFTDPMGDEFKKAMEKVFEDLEKQKGKKKTGAVRRKKPASKAERKKKTMKRLSRKTRETMR